MKEQLILPPKKMDHPELEKSLNLISGMKPISSLPQSNLATSLV